MPNLSFARLTSRDWAVALVILLGAASAWAGEKVIFPLTSQYPNSSSGLATDGAGNLYGIVGGATASSCSSIFELSPASGGTWTQTILYTFQNCIGDGMRPIGTLTLDSQGNIYGVESSGIGSGRVYELKKGSNGTWTYGLVHSFNPSEGGPEGDLTLDKSGNLYGASSYRSSAAFDGEVFELSPQPGGSWKETILYTFDYGDGPNGPAGGVIFDSQGNLYGATSYYGDPNGGGAGAVYELSPQTNGPWKLTLLYEFVAGTKATLPDSRLTFDSSGNLYGTMEGGGNFYGGIFELSPSSGGTWTETTVHDFTGGSDGLIAVGNLVVGASGNLYGATYRGGNGCNKNLCGLVYKFLQSGGTWKETILHPFESADDGSQPGAGLLIDSAGNLYGTTINGGGRFGYGTVYEITP
jgi:uncharacterized repeat protein (TIGR03803 family)